LQGSDRARAAEESSFCDTSTGTIGVIIEVGGCAIGGTDPTPRCVTAADATEVYVFDLESRSLEGVFSTSALDDSMRYLETSLSKLEHPRGCDRVGELVLVARTPDRLQTRTFGHKRTGACQFAPPCRHPSCRVMPPEERAERPMGRMPRIGRGVDQLFESRSHRGRRRFCRVMPPLAGGEGPKGRRRRQQRHQLSAGVVLVSAGAVEPWPLAFPAADRRDRVWA